MENRAANGREFEAIGTVAQRFLPFTLRLFTVEDLDAAQAARTAIGTCPHDPPCATIERCWHALAIAHRLRRGMR